MNDEKEKNKPIKFIRELCKDKTENEILDAEESFREYMSVIREMCDRLDSTEPHFD
jgi:hypothetical protein